MGKTELSVADYFSWPLLLWGLPLFVSPSDWWYFFQIFSVPFPHLFNLVSPPWLFLVFYHSIPTSLAYFVFVTYSTLLDLGYFDAFMRDKATVNSEFNYAEF